MKRERYLNPISFFLSLCMMTFLAFPFLQAACCGDQQRESSSCPHINCNWERTDRKCNDDSECCPGKECTSFGFCELCR